ncbi:MAG TPA: DUF6252 family protein, partial [Chitinophagaceae bacterium]|nr:DUF6252 family protein [Chitinophagaceae bacterium]
YEGATRMLGLINIGGRSTDRKYLSITLTDSGVHNYTLDNMSMNAAAYIDSSLANPVNFTTNQGIAPGDAGGFVNITSIDVPNKRISGTFSFRVFRQMDGAQRTLTEGSFTNLPYVTTLPPSNSTDTFRVKIAGTLWVPPVILGSKTPAAPPLTSQLVVTGTSSDATKSVGIFMPDGIAPGNYTFDLFGATYIGLYNPDTDPNHSQASMSGTLTILSNNTTTRRIRGNFNFHAEALLNPLLNTELTEGYFSVKY